MTAKNGYLEKLETCIPGLDAITLGGLPRGRNTLVAGSAGSAKTILASQFLAAGIMHRNENGVFVTFEEAPRDIRANMKSMNWDIERWEAEGKWAFVDASPLLQETIAAGPYDLTALIARVDNAVKKVNAVRVSLDSLGSIFTQLSDPSIIRRELYQIASKLREIGVTSILTAERTSEHGEISRYGVEEFVADNVIILRNVLEDEKRRRTIETLKFRGATHQKGEFPFTVSPGEGIIIIPLSEMQLKQKSTDIRVCTGNKELDTMTGGGFFQDSVVLVTGATGCGKTLLTTEFIAGGAASNERCLLLAYEESRDQLFRNASGWGIDYAKMEAEGRLKVICTYPETAATEDHLIAIKAAIHDFKPTRLAIDSLSALERTATAKGFREFVVSLTSFVKHEEICGLFTATTPSLLGGTSVTETHISTITDSIILLRYVEVLGEMRRGLTILKMRGSAHEREIREFTIDGTGMSIGQPFRNVMGILSGYPRHIGPEETERVSRLFQESESRGAIAGT